MQPNATREALLRAYSESGFLPDLLPILPADAALSPDSTVPEFNRGKVPGRLRGSAWYGFPDWQEHVTSENDIARWSSWPKCGIGINTRRLVAIDIDVTDETLAAEVEALACDMAGGLWPNPPVRYGNAPKRLVLFRAVVPVTKRRLAFHLPGDPVEINANGSRKAHHAVEILGKGQQFVAHGVHPKTGKPYHWKDDVTPADPGRGFDELTPLSSDEVDEFLRTVEKLLIEHGGELAQASGVGRQVGAPGVSGPGRKPIGAPELLAPDPNTAVAALKAMPNDIDRERWVGVAHAFKAAVGGDEEFYGPFEDWCLQWPDNTPEKARALWDSIRDAEVGAHALFGAAREAAPEFIEDAKDEFEALDDAGGEGGAPAGPLSKMDMLFARYVYAEDVQRFIDLEDKTLMDEKAFSIRHADIGNHWEGKSKAATQYLANMSARRVLPRVTYRPGQPNLLTETDGQRAVNVWRPSPMEIPKEPVSDREVSWWLDHMRRLIPDDWERGVVIDWCAYVLQGNKPNWAVLIGGGQGIGKDMAFQPVIRALGTHNVKIIGPDDLKSGYTDWAANAQLVIVEEMKNYEKGEVSNRLKAYITCPPDEVRVNAKYTPQYQTPNVAAYLFFTNYRDALNIELKDRRFFIVWSEAEPQADAYYAKLAERIGSDSAKVAAWLTARDVSRFAGKGRAPDTKAKDEMRRASMSPVSAWVADAIADGEEPFNTDIVVIADVAARVPASVKDEAGKGALSKKMAHALRDAGAVPIGDDYVRLGQVLPSIGRDRGRLWIVRRHKMLENLPVQQLVALFWKQRDDAVAREFAD